MIMLNQRNNFLNLSVSDNATGMTPEVLQNVSQNKFSTKQTPSVHEHGWGLSSVRSLIQELNGKMQIHSIYNQPYSGTRVEITVPL